MRNTGIQLLLLRRGLVGFRVGLGALLEDDRGAGNRTGGVSGGIEQVGVQGHHPSAFGRGGFGGHDGWILYGLVWENGEIAVMLR